MPELSNYSDGHGIGRYFKGLKGRNRAVWVEFWEEQEGSFGSALILYVINVNVLIGLKG